ncbi:hypothetical protein AOLI_G00179870 [Acnodon oligacanthus]
MMLYQRVFSLWSIIMKRSGNLTKKSFVPELRNIPERPSNPLSGRQRVNRQAKLRDSPVYLERWLNQPKVLQLQIISTHRWS